jgi:propanol-preferring alcohol dehydrogenase
MRAFQMVRWQAPAELRDVAVPVPGPGQVLVRIGGAGACHSDLHVMEWPAGQLPWALPFTLGHENAGWIEMLGPGVEGWARGDAVAIYGPWGCGRCQACRQGRENTCRAGASLPAAGGGLGRDGGLAEYMLVDSARHLVPLGGLDPVEAAPLSDAALTPYHAIRRHLGLCGPGETVVVIGLGGLGHMAVQLLRAVAPVQVVGVDVADDKLAEGRAAGAHEVVRSDGHAAEAVRALTGGAGAALVLDCVGADATLALGARVLRPEGRLVIIGLAGGALPTSFFALPYDAAIESSYWGTISELGEVIALAAAGRVRAHVERYRLAEAAEVYARLRAGRVRGRAVIVP